VGDLSEQTEDCPCIKVQVVRAAAATEQGEPGRSSGHVNCRRLDSLTPSQPASANSYQASPLACASASANSILVGRCRRTCRSRWAHLISSKQVESRARHSLGSTQACWRAGGLARSSLVCPGRGIVMDGWIAVPIGQPGQAVIPPLAHSKDREHRQGLIADTWCCKSGGEGATWQGLESV
jgi:hypothetical protein